ncbi:hypothetical protein DCAR_0102915 [Daucus carota subsp. sativus]|uniref:Uncharacterized protein n=1 Tax=Daucus carota subsp. sativus TaxID=79200 RepID=A0A166HDN0_DAUCS|nr:hypothetical protein DCAR_0102915 [Daucus carota subsp. sativus]
MVQNRGGTERGGVRRNEERRQGWGGGSLFCSCSGELWDVNTECIYTGGRGLGFGAQIQRGRGKDKWREREDKWSQTYTKFSWWCNGTLESTQRSAVINPVLVTHFVCIYSAGEMLKIMYFLIKLMKLAILKGIGLFICFFKG